jgi:peptidoglycan/xylan/chitin deacetylase (PgdA/CDA1 family)
VLLVLALAGGAAAAAVLVAPSAANRHPHRSPPALAVPATPPHHRVRSDTRVQIAAVERLARFGLPLYCGGRRKRMVALTFDDGPGVYTRLAVKKLRQHRLRATFFLVDKSIRGYPRLVGVEKAVAAFGDHTMTHPFLPALARSAVVWQINAARVAIERATGQPVVLFRPPYGGRTPAIDHPVKALGMLEVLWNVDSQDSLGLTDYLAIEQNVLAGLRPGSIILMHENHGQTIRALPVILSALARRHLRAVTLPELISADPPSLAQLRRGVSGCTISLRRTNGG